MLNAASHKSTFNRLTTRLTIFGHQFTVVEHHLRRMHHAIKCLPFGLTDFTKLNTTTSFQLSADERLPMLSLILALQLKAPVVSVVESNAGGKRDNSLLLVRQSTATAATTTTTD